MELRISVSELAKSLSKVIGIIPKKNTNPILLNVLLEAKVTDQGQGQIVLSATDLNISIQLVKACEVITPGSVAVGVRAISDMVRVLSGPDVTLKLLDNNHLEVRCGRTKAKLVALSGEEYPPFPELSSLKPLTLHKKQFCDMVQRTVFCASGDESRYNLTGVYLEPQKDKSNQIAMIATDGHRLSKVERTFENADFSELSPMILPRKGLGELIKLLTDVDIESDDFSFAVSDNKVVVQSGTVILIMRLIDGTFPDYKQVIPSVADKIVRSSRSDILNSLKRVSVMASDKTQDARLAISGDNLTVSCTNPDAGEIKDDIPIEYNGPDIQIAFNAKYLIDAITSLNDHNLHLKITDALSPGLWVGAEDPEHLCVIMPMRI
jgi:DNA polymerase-3 subunit beta